MPKVIFLNSDGTKRCSRCRETKPASQFYSRRETKSGLTSACIECSRAHDKKRENTPNRKATRKWAAIKWFHGLTRQEWQAALEAQNFRCAICETAFDVTGKSMFNPCIDHDHDTDKIRGLLCRRCNQGIGLLQDSGNVAEKAALYLKRHGK
jgi:hypothetical protein